MTPSSRLSCRRSFTRWQETNSLHPDGSRGGVGLRDLTPREGREEVAEYLPRPNDGVAKPTCPQADFPVRRWVVSMVDDFKVVLTHDGPNI